MPDRFPSLDSLRVFECAARHCSFTLAATELSVTQGAVSSRIRQLEKQLGVQLFRRRIRQVSLTDEGQRLFKVANRVLNELQNELAAISEKPVKTTLRIAVSTYVATRWLSPRLGDFYRAYPEISLQLQHSVNDPDFDISDVDLAIRWSNDLPEQSRSEVLLSSPMFAACSPSLLKQSPKLNDYQILMDQVFLHDQVGSDNWALWLSKAGLGDLGAGNGPVIIDPNVRVQAAIDGHGWILADCLINNELETGLLIKPFDMCLNDYSFQLQLSNQAIRNPHLQQLGLWLLEQAQQFELKLLTSQFSAVNTKN